MPAMRSALFGFVLACGLAAACGRTSLDDEAFEASPANAGTTAQSGTTGSGGRSAGSGAIAGMPGAGARGGMPGAGAAPGTGGFAAMPSGGVAGVGGTIVDAGPDAPLNCGDGVLDPGEACDLGAGNEYRPALWLVQGATSAELSPLVTDSSVQLFYGYESASSHTGFEELRASRLIVHRSSFDQALTLVMHHGIDSDSSGQQQPASAVSFTITGLPNTAVVAISDDSGEVNKTAADTVTAIWKFNGNSDGGAVGGLPFPGNWTITITPAFTRGIDSWASVDNAGMVSLDLATPVTIYASDSPAQCRTNCTMPYCGDGVLDGGEVCDDGNTLSGDGCSASCFPE